MDATSSKGFSRKQWRENSHFHSVSEKEVLELIARRVEQFKLTQRPLVLLDLDSTLYDVAPRTIAIVQDWLERSPTLPQELKLALQSLTPAQMGYSVKDTLGNLGFPVVTQELEQIATQLKSFWWDRFFSSDYLPHDRPYGGAVEYANHLYDIGADICYLTGRDQNRMRKGTEANLIRDGFPFSSSGIQLLMRQEPDISDASHKAQQANRLAQQGILVASFENEPVNLVTLSKLLPQTAHIFVDTVCSDSEAEPGKNLYCIRGFSSFVPPGIPQPH